MVSLARVFQILVECKPDLYRASTPMRGPGIIRAFCLPSSQHYQTR
jgi:hypothetical protein